FVDVGVHQDGLVHISQLSSERFVKDPREVVNPGDRVQVKVLSVDLARQRISLTMRLGEPAEASAARPDAPRGATPAGRGNDRGGVGGGRPPARPEPPKPEVDRRWAALTNLRK
ncbi:MAG TPA: S1 RNA-binding domain-containing protein, partial [Thermoanaerobaculia bacterium]|nr:S1 RNA-binding domain-containing protein [Thermoanaerobaculia bacterium]